MDKLMLQELPPHQREATLKDNCAGIEVKGYSKRFTDPQLQAMKDVLSEVSIDANEIEEEKKAVVAIFKSRLEPLNEKKKTLLRNLKYKAEHVKEDCFKFLDFEDKMVGYYNSQGELIEARPMLQEEMQTNMFAVKKTGTNN